MRFLLVAFFLSGIAGLSYELTWLRYLSQLFGASTPAVSATVSIFFLGMAFGSILGARYFSKRSNPVKAYAILELLIGCVAATVPFLFRVADSIFIALSLPNDNPWVLLGFSTILLFLPTCLLGATFPAMAAALRNQKNRTHSTGIFYGLNTLGAVLGCIFVSFWWLPSFGQAKTTWAMGCINVLVGALVWFFGKNSQPVQEETEEQTESSAKQVDTDQQLSMFGASIIAGLTGFLAIGIEVLWSRALSLSVPGTVYIFALILAAYLVGIGFGSLFVAWWHKKHLPRKETLSFLYLFLAIGVLLTTFLFPSIFWISSWFLQKGHLVTWDSYALLLGSSSILCMLPATLAMGASLPLLIGLTSAKNQQPSQVAGRLYAINTVGGIFGSMVATYYLMPRIGVTNTIVLLAMIYLLLGSILFGLRFRKASPRFIIAGLLGLLVFFGLMQFYNDVNPLRHRAKEKLIFYKDDSSATVAIYETKKKVRILRTNNHYGLSRTDKPTLRMQYKLGLLPLLMHPKPKNSLLIGFATGTTLAAMASYPVKQADCVELHPLIPSLAKFFGKSNFQVWKNPKVKLMIADGRRYLLRRGKQYDVIVGDLYLPRNPGVGSLFSVEHFKAVKNRLSKQGLFVSWLPAFQLGPNEMASVIASFLKVFPNAEGWIPHWSTNSPIIGLVGRKNPAMKLRGAPATELFFRTESLLHPKKKKLFMKRFEVWKMKDQQPLFKPLRLLPNKLLKKWAQKAPLNKLEYPYVEFSAPKTMMQAKMTRFPIKYQNIWHIGQLRNLKQTPWKKVFDTINIRYMKKMMK